MKKYVIIVAGGKGTRMNTSRPKQFLPIGGTPILMHTLSAFYTYDASIQIILVLPFAQFPLWEELCKTYKFNLPHQLVEGGTTRFHSVKNGLAKISPEVDSLVAIHDGVRPFASHTTIANAFASARQNGSGIPATPLVDSIRFFDEKGNQAVNRDHYRLVQTPQVFQSALIKEAYKQPYKPAFTDDASVVEALGNKIYLVEGNKENIKITTPFDLKIAEAILNSKEEKPS